MPNWRSEARKAAQRYGLDPNIFERQINQESGFNPTARSPAGAQGIAQIMPATARGWGVNPLDPHAALNAAASHMASDVRKYGSYENALRAYNAGPGAIEKSKGYAETNNYVRTILGGQTPKAPTRPAGGGGSSGTSTTVTTPGVDNRGARAQLIQSFLSGHNRNPLTFALQARDLQDVAPTSTTSHTPAPGKVGTTGEPTGVHGSKVLELIFNDGGKGYGIKNGQEVDGRSVYSAVWAGHPNHVHVAAGPKTVVELGNLAQQMGLHVGENPHFGGVSQGAHVADSYHYKGEAIDVSGDKSKMAAFARRVKRYSDSQ